MEAVTAAKPRILPKATRFILAYNLFEKYSTLGLIVTLAIFLHTKLGLDEDTSTAIYHYFLFASYFFSIVGGIVADTWLGSYKTLLYGMSILGGIGNVLLAVGTVEYWNYLMSSFVVISLILISFAVGCMEPNLPAYTGAQYRLPMELKGFGVCIGLLFFVQNIAKFISVLVNPVLRTTVKCFGADDCYPLIFGSFVVTKILGMITLLISRRYAVLVEPKGNMFVKIWACIFHAIKLKMTSKDTQHYEHWLDRSEPKYGPKIVFNTKNTLHILQVLAPVALITSLFFQPTSRWIFQGNQMNGQIGSFTIKPDQVPLIHALFIMIFVPTCEYIVNPLIAKVGIRNNLQRASLGIFISATSFVIAALLQMRIDRQETHILWQLPQQIVLALGEVLLYVQLQQFAYTQAPKEIKSVIQAFFAIGIGGGNLIAALIASTKIFDSMMYEFLMFAGITYTIFFLFLYFDRTYKYVVVGTDDDKDIGEDNVTESDVNKET